MKALSVSAVPGLLLHAVDMTESRRIICPRAGLPISFLPERYRSPRACPVHIRAKCPGVSNDAALYPLLDFGLTLSKGTAFFLFERFPEGKIRRNLRFLMTLNDAHRRLLLATVPIGFPSPRPAADMKNPQSTKKSRQDINVFLLHAMRIG